MDTETVLTSREKVKLCHNGHMYVFDNRSKKDATVSFWRCHQRNLCKGRANAVNEKITKITREHNHGSAPAEIEIAKIKSDIKKAAGL